MDKKNIITILYTQYNIIFFDNSVYTWASKSLIKKKIFFIKKFFQFNFRYKFDHIINYNFFFVQTDPKKNSSPNSPKSNSKPIAKSEKHKPNVKTEEVNDDKDLDEINDEWELNDDSSMIEIDADDNELKKFDESSLNKFDINKIMFDDEDDDF